jgi:hypothetical protein
MYYESDGMSDVGDAFKPESFIPQLETIRTTLIRHEYIDQATVLAELIDLAYLRSTRFPEKLRGG